MLYTSKKYHYLRFSLLFSCLLLISIFSGCEVFDPTPPPIWSDPCKSITRGNYAMAAYGSALWSPVGDSIIFGYSPMVNVWRNGNWWYYSFDTTKTGIYSKGLAVSDTPRILYLTNDYFSLEDWSRDGNWILSYSRGAFWQIRSDWSERRFIIKAPYGFGFPRFSPDGKKVIYGGEGNLYLVNIDGSYLHKIAGGAMPRFGPEGKIYTLYGTFSSDYYVKRLDTSGVWIDSILIHNLWDFQLSPDGNLIAYRAGTRDDVRLYVRDYKGTFNRCIIETADGLNEETYHWSRNSDAIVYRQFHPCIHSKTNSRLWITDLYGNKRQFTFND